MVELTAKLRSAGVRMWMDVRNIDSAAMWGEEIVNALAKSKVLLLLVSKSSVASRNVVKMLLASERKGHILPVDLEPTEIPVSLKFALAGIQHIEYFRGDLDTHMSAILRALERVGVNLAVPQPCASRHFGRGTRSGAQTPDADSSEALKVIRRPGSVAIRQRRPR